MDATIPQHPVGRPMAASYGWFVRCGDRVVLRDRRGNDYALRQVSIVQGGFGFDVEGVSKLPRPEVIDPTTGAVIVRGDRVLILWLDGNPTTPVVLPGVRSLRADDFLPVDHSSGADPNRWAMRVRARDDAGNVLGTVDIELCRNAADAGTARVTASGDVSIQASEVRLGDDTATSLVALADLVKAELDALWAKFNSHVHAGVTAGASSTAVPVDVTGSAGAVASSKVRAS